MIEELDLNDKREKYKLFYGPNINQAYNISKDKDRRDIMVIPQIIGMKNESFYSTSEDFKNAWEKTSFDVADGIAFYGDEIVILRNSPHIRNLRPWLDKEKELRKGALILSEEEYKALDGLRLTRKEAEKYICHHPESDLMSPKKVLDNVILDYLFSGRRDCLEEHVRYTFSKENPRNAMRIFIKPSLEDVPTLRAWHIKGNTSDFYGTSNLDRDNGRFIGILSEVNLRETHLDLNKSASNILRGIEEVSNKVSKAYTYLTGKKLEDKTKEDCIYPPDSC